MKLAVATTTIRIPRAMELLQAHRSPASMQYFTAADEKTPKEYQFENFLAVEQQKGFGYKCSELIGWRCIQRRNIAVLEAIKWGAEAIVLWDDDNLAINSNYFYDFEKVFQLAFSGLAVNAPDLWFDPGQLLLPAASHRGFPHDKPTEFSVDFETDVAVGVAAGLCLGDPDVSACTRVASAPIATGMTEIGRAGVVVQPGTWTVFNSQNTCFLRELAPAMFLPPGIFRYDDIFASLICQRVMREKDLFVHFGQPAIWQSRNPHNLVSDLKAELWGMENILDFAAILDKIIFVSGQSVLDMARAIWTNERIHRFLPEQSWKAALAFLDDLEPIL